MKFSKRMSGVFVFLIFGMFLISMVGGVLAADGDLPVGEIDPEKAAEGVGMVWEWGESFFSALFGDTVLGAETLSRIFMILLIAMFVYTAFETFFGDNLYIRWGATIAASALAIIGLPDGFLEAVRTGYGAMGATILSVIPFLIIFWFTIKAKSLLLARLTWLFYAFYYLALFLSGFVTRVVTNGGVKNVSTWVYLSGFLIGLFIFIIIPHIRKFIWHGELEEIKEKGSQKNTLRQTLLAQEMERLKVDQ
jgi:hypothetical protein